MNIKDLHPEVKALSTATLFKTSESNVTSIQLLAGEQLKEHITKVPALLICVVGDAIYEDENGLKLTLTSGDYVNIEPQIKHWINATSTSNLILIR